MVRFTKIGTKADLGTKAERRKCGFAALHAGRASRRFPWRWSDEFAAGWRAQASPQEKRAQHLRVDSARRSRRAQHRALSDRR
jgi:hypothetical protein